MKRCPDWRYWVYKAEGCDAMRCRWGCSFCYRCGTKYKDAHRCTCQGGRGGFLRPRVAREPRRRGGRRPPRHQLIDPRVQVVEVKEIKFGDPQNEGHHGRRNPRVAVVQVW